MTFQKGNDCGKGRPKGSLNNTTKNTFQLKKLASERYEEAFSMLWEAMKEKEAWAYNLYFKELVPKKVYGDTIFIERSNNTNKDRLSSIIGQLGEFEELTHEEALNEIKVLGGLKLGGGLQSEDQNTNICELLSDQELEILKNKAKVLEGV